MKAILFTLYVAVVWWLRTLVTNYKNVLRSVHLFIKSKALNETHTYQLCTREKTWESSLG